MFEVANQSFHALTAHLGGLELFMVEEILLEEFF